MTNEVKEANMLSPLFFVAVSNVATANTFKQKSAESGYIRSISRPDMFLFQLPIVKRFVVRR
jgi:hypothetical protein